ncbi:efflux RND transporter permease subunit [Candidatus Binatia bacterium]|nr:efflux RND transporter permease subunit [Candidatus Binatia bacterium]
MIRRAIELPYVVIVGVLVVAVLGTVSYRQLAADLLPVFDTPAVQIVTFYPGMPPEVMERDITSRLERWTGQSIGIDHQEAKSMLGVSIVKDFFREGVSFDTAMSQVTSYAVSDMFYLPPGTIPPMVMPFDPTASVPLCLVAVSSPTMSEKEIYDVAYFELRNRLQSIPGVIAPAVYGGTLRRILAYVDREKLEARELSPMDVVRALHRQSVFVPAGNMKAGETDYQIFANAMPAAVEQLNHVPVSAENGKVVFMRDVASVEDSAQIQSNIVRINGRRQVYIPIYRQPGANTIEIVDAIRSQLQRIRQRLREMDARAGNIALEVVLDQSVYVRNSIAGLRLAALLGAALAGAVVFMFLRTVRSTIVIVLAIPLAVLGAMIGLVATRQSLNTLTLGGIALAIGILVDQAIVVVENVARHLGLGKDAARAAIDGTREVAPSIVVSTVTFAVVFVPIFFLSGMARFLFAPLAISASLVMGASLVVALTVVPAFCARFLTTAVGVRDGADAGLLARGYTWGLARAVGRRGVVLTAGAAAAIAAAVALQRHPTELFPRVDAGQFQIYVRLPSGTRIEETEKTVARLESALIAELGEPDPEFPAVENEPRSDLRMLIGNIGVLMDWPAAYTPNTGPMDAFVLVQLKENRRDTFALVERLRGRLRHQFPEVEFAFDTGGMLTAALNFGEPAPIRFRVLGSDLRTLGEIAARVAERIGSVPGAEDVRVLQRNDYPTLDIEIDRTKAALAGLSVVDVMHNLVTATNSSINFEPAFWIDRNNGNHYFVGAQYRESDHVSTDTLLDVPIAPGGGGKPLPLRTVATISRGTGPSFVSHRDITRAVDVYADVAPGAYVGDVVGAMEQVLEEDAALGLERTVDERGRRSFRLGGEYAERGYVLTASGEIETMRAAFGQFAGGLALAVVLVYLVMVAQFRSFVDPLTILLTVPLGFVGVALALRLAGVALNIQSLMGIVMMVGIVVEYGILMVDFANARVESGMPVDDAVLEAARLRLRPILMTSLTTVFALLPMAVGAGGGDANIPLATTIIGGVLGATVLTLFVLPGLYILMKRAPLGPALMGGPADET